MIKCSCVLGWNFKKNYTKAGNMRDSSTDSYVYRFHSPTPCSVCNPTAESVETFWRVERIEKILEYHNLGVPE